MTAPHLTYQDYQDIRADEKLFQDFAQFAAENSWIDTLNLEDLEQGNIDAIGKAVLAAWEFDKEQH